ncbi:hypothetical protein BDD12DRAFT_821055 [Trichophaea hybrida]|nr:hypothetical protein BDD12DRAFT_821055 [Trichophaea hybrida]
MPRPSHGIIGLAFLAARGLQALCLLVTLSLASRFISSMVEAQQAPPSPLIGILCVICFAILYCGTTILLYFDHQLPLIPAAGIDMLFFLALMVSSIMIGKPLSYLSCQAIAQGTTKELLENIGDRLNQGPSPTTVATATTTAQAFVPYVAPTPTTTSTIIEYAATAASNAAATVTATLTPGSDARVKGSDGNLYTVTGRSLLAARDIVIKTPDYRSWISSGSASDCMMMKAVWGFGIALTIMFVFSAVMVAFIWKGEVQKLKQAARKAGEA